MHILEVCCSLFLCSLKKLFSYRAVHGHTPCHFPTFSLAMENEKFYISQSMGLKTISQLQSLIVYHLLKLNLMLIVYHMKQTYSLWNKKLKLDFRVVFFLFSSVDFSTLEFQHGLLLLFSFCLQCYRFLGLLLLSISSRNQSQNSYTLDVLYLTYCTLECGEVPHSALGLYLIRKQINLDYFKYYSVVYPGVIEFDTKGLVQE